MESTPMQGFHETYGRTDDVMCTLSFQTSPVGRTIAVLPNGEYTSITMSNDPTQKASIPLPTYVLPGHRVGAGDPTKRHKKAVHWNHFLPRKRYWRGDGIATRLLLSNALPGNLYQGCGPPFPNSWWQKVPPRISGHNVRTTFGMEFGAHVDIRLCQVGGQPYPRDLRMRCVV